MCGIAGFLIHHPHNPRPDASLLGREDQREAEALVMIERLAHRGPDGQGLWIAPPMYLGHTRLAIIDPTPDGHQPMGDSTQRYWISYNGEIYNYRELRSELQRGGAVFHTHSDTEVLLQAYRVWGREMLQRLDGMFAFAIWDQLEQSLWLARDAVGIKPLFYAPMQDRFLFASEIKAILAASVDPIPDRHALGAFFAFGYAVAPATGFQNVRQLLPGHELTVKPNQRDPRPRRWFRWPYPSNPTTWSRWESADRLGHAIRQSVRAQLRSDVPLGAFLSGGLDSSTIVACMAELQSEPIHTFSVAMALSSFDESEPARAVAEQFHTLHHAPLIDASHFDQLLEVVRHAEDPIADNSLLPFWFLCNATSKHVSVALSGDGADELLAGYATYRATHLARLYRRLPTGLRHHLLKRCVHYLPVSERKYGWSMFARRFIAAADQPWPRDHASWRLMLDADYSRWLRADDWSASLVRSIDAYAEPLSDAPPWLDPTECMLHMDLAFHLANDMLVKVDRMSMAHALEVRVPFLGKSVLETSLAIPSKWKGPQGRGKQVLRDAMRSKLPVSIVDRKKAGFVIPIESWLRGPWLDELKSVLNKEFCQETGMLQYEGVERLIREHALRTADHAYPLFTLLVFALWWNEWMRISPSHQLHPFDASRTKIRRWSGANLEAGK